MGMRATVSRDMLLQEVFVPDDAEVLPPGLFGAMYNGYPHLFLSFSATFLGLMQVAWDGALAYLSGRMPGAPIPHSEIAAKGQAIAEMLFAIEAARALYYRAISEAQVDPPLEAVQRARAAHVTVQRAVVTVTQEAIRVCGGRGLPQALSARALRPRRTRRSTDAPVDRGDRDAAGLGGSTRLGRAGGRCRRGVTVLSVGCSLAVMIATQRVDTAARPQQRQPAPVCVEPVLDLCHLRGLSASGASVLTASP
jgi:hypothetical protein